MRNSEQRKMSKVYLVVEFWDGDGLTVRCAFSEEKPALNEAVRLRNEECKDTRQHFEVLPLEVE